MPNRTTGTKIEAKKTFTHTQYSYVVVRFVRGLVLFWFCLKDKAFFLSFGREITPGRSMQFHVIRTIEIHLFVLSASVYALNQSIILLGKLLG